MRPYVDYQTGVAGIKRGISYQSLAEELYIEPHQGIQSGSPGKEQIRRALKGLERAGIIRIQSFKWKLVVHCVLVVADYSVPNKPDTNQPYQSAIKPHEENSFTTRATASSVKTTHQKATGKADIPLMSEKNNMCVYAQFEKFWLVYPKKMAKQKAWELFQELQPTEALFDHMLSSLQRQVEATQILKSRGQWVPKWKFPANWLAQQCWDDEINTTTHEESNHANDSGRHATQGSVDHFWESCKAGAKPSTSNNVLSINAGRA